MNESYLFSGIMFALGLIFFAVTLGLVIRRAFSRQAGEIGGWELRGAGGRIFAVARTTLAEGLRAKVASGFALLILVSIPLFWLTAEGDGTVKGQVQMFMTYSLGFTSFLLALLTIFFSCQSLSNEVLSRQIYTVVSKPIPRWQILAGKWVGIVSLNAVLLMLACVGTYVGTRAIVSRFKTDLTHDLETYGGLTPEQAATTVAALDHVKGVGKKGPQSPVVYTMAEALGQTQEQVAEMLLRLPEPTRVNLRRFDELRRQVLVARTAVHPELPDVTERVDEEYKRLEEEGRLPENWGQGKIRKQIEAELLGDYCSVPPGAWQQWKLQGPVPDARDDFIMSVRFKLYVGGQLPAIALPSGPALEKDTLLCAWGIGDPRKPSFYAVEEPFAVQSTTEFEIPISCVDEDGTILVTFANLDPRRVDAVFDLPDGLEVLYRVGSFERNICQVFLAILIPIICLASFGVCASTFLSFPVGSLILIMFYVIVSSMGFVRESLAVTDEYVPPAMQGLRFRVRRLTVDTIGWALSIGDSGPVDQLREGRIVGWPTLWEKCWKFVLLKSTAVMVVGLLVFRRRELAAVIV
jgi:hypothetical protein